MNDAAFIPDVGALVPLPFHSHGDPVWIVRSLTVEHGWVRIGLEHILDMDFKLSVVVPLWHFEAA